MVNSAMKNFRGTLFSIDPLSTCLSCLMVNPPIHANKVEKKYLIKGFERLLVLHLICNIFACKLQVQNGFKNSYTHLNKEDLKAGYQHDIT